MANTPNLEFANNGGFLWPPIADALDTFLRRRMRNADPFERVWRLIHLWEASEITLALAAIAVASRPGANAHILKRQREFFYGKSWDPLTESFKELQGAADGAIDQWINILDEVAKAEELQGRFLPALRSFLMNTAIDVAPLVSAWAKTCDVPSDYQERGVVEVRVAMRYVNSFRNRFAHVPFPHDPLAEVSDALEKATEQLFSIEPLPASHEKDGRSSPLTGALQTGTCFLRGSQLESIPGADGATELRFVFPCQKRKDPESWPADVLVHIDPMMRPHVLTRVKGLDVSEYTRFRAEANAVLVVPDSGIAKYLPAPERKDYLPQGFPTEERREIGQSEALEAIRDGDFDTGISFFSRLLESRPAYHVGWLRLGHARREKAVRLSESDPAEAKRLLEAALGDLLSAGGHIDPGYKALAHYERSKAFYRLAQLEPAEASHAVQARDEAAEAFRLSNERKYQTWWQHLEAFNPGAEQVAASQVAVSDQPSI